MNNVALPYLLFLGDATPEFGAKTAQGVLHWRPEACAAQWTLPGGSLELGLPEMAPKEAAAAGARTLLIGVTNRGGILPDHWVPSLKAALEAGLDIASGLHQRMVDIPVLAETASLLGRTLHDVRHPTALPPLATGAPRSGNRILTIGTDCAVGKKFTALSIHAEMRAQGIDARFVATGQTGLLIAGGGMAIDALPADFIAGAVEAMAPAADNDHWDVIEGQATVLHPSYGGVTLGLVHGAQAEAMIICHRPGQSTVRGLPDRPLPSMAETIAAHERAATVTRPEARREAKVVGISLDTHHMDEQTARGAIARIEKAQALPTTDPVRFGAGALVEAVLNAP